MPGVVIENPALGGARAVVDPAAMHDWQLRGWEPQGPYAEESGDERMTEQEWAAELARRESEVAAVLAGKKRATAK